MAIFPVAGLILLIVGVRQRSRASAACLPLILPPAPDPYGPLPGPSGHRIPRRQQYYPSPPSRRRVPRRSIALIVIGSLLLVFGLLGILGRTGDLLPQHRDAPPSLKVGQCVAQSSVPSTQTGAGAAGLRRPGLDVGGGIDGGGRRVARTASSRTPSTRRSSINPPPYASCSTSAGTVLRRDRHTGQPDLRPGRL